MTEENSMILDPAGEDPVLATDADPGNSDPSVFTEDLTDDETLEANSAVEAAILLLPVDNQGVL